MSVRGENVTLVELIVLYCLAMSLATALAAFWLSRRRERGRLLYATGHVLAAAGGLALVLSDGFFSFAHLLGYGVFLWLPLFLCAAAWLLRRECRLGSRLAGSAALVVWCVAVDAYWIEPYWLEVSHHELESPKLDQPLRIAVLADFQTDVFGDYERQSLERILDEKPDVILLAGDYLQTRDPRLWDALRIEMNAYLHQIGFSAPLGVYAVGGNVDYPQWPRIFDGLPVTIFEHTGLVENDRFAVTGLSIEYSFQSRLVVQPKDQFHIVLGHAPDYALGDVQADLLVAGHTHGGQVRLPWFGPLKTFSEVPRSWAAGLTALSGGRTLAVSRGVGMERADAPRMRFLCRPELMVIDILPAD